MSQNQDKNALQKKAPWYVAMALGGVSGMVATTIVHPLDLIKVRLQLLSRYCTTRDMAQQIIRCRGFRALYAGLTAGLMRQTTYTTARVGAYHAMYNIYQRKVERRPILIEKLVFGVTAGIAGALAGTPSDVLLVRLMADGPLEPCITCSCDQKYRGTVHAITKICQEEGVKALWRGGTLTVGRSVLISIGQIQSYSQVREIFRERDMGKGLTLHISTSLISSFFTAFVSLPIDLVKTRYQVKERGVSHRDIIEDILHRKGFSYFWKGFVPYYVRMGIHTVVSLVVIDRLYLLYLHSENGEVKYD